MVPDVFRGIYALSSFISLLLFAYILNFLVKLESTGCECAMDWRRTYIMFYMSYMLLFNIASLTMLFSKNPPPVLRRIYAVFSPLSIILGILFVVFTFQYVHRLRKEKCACSEELGRTILTLVAAIDAAVFAVIGLIMLFSLIGLMFGLTRKSTPR